MQELLTLFICTTPYTGCAQAQQTYLHYHPEIKEISKRIEQQIPKILVTNVGPIVTIMARKEINLPVTNHLTFTVTETTSKLIFTFGF
jgi:hypothetical protein